MIICPACRSASVTYKAKAKEWECLDCEERFPGPLPSAPADQSEFRPSKAALPKAIFFSYGHDQNRELVDRFKSDLEKRGHTVWVDYKEIGAWSDWRGKITEGIHGSQLAMAFLSKHATRDPGVCRNEIAMALNRFGTVYPILLEPEQEVTPPVTITHLQWQDLSQWRQICDGLVQGKEWERWYEERLLEIISLVEGEASQFEGEISALRAVLQPTTFSSDIARHFPGFVGREWVFDAYHEWLDHQPESRLFWIKAGPGVGKTAISAMLAHEHQQAIVGAWFCQTGSIERSDPHKALHTLAFQLAARWPDYRIKLRFQLGFNASTSPKDWENLRESLLKKNLTDLFHHLFAEPLTGLIYRDRRLVIVIDALDEATDGEGKNELTDLIAGQFSKLPSWLGFIVTSRPDPTVMSRLQGFKPFALDAHDERNHADLGQYLDIELGKQVDFARLPETERSRLKNLLLEKSEGMVLYLQQIVEGLKTGALTLSTLGETPRGLGGLYHNDFAHRFASNDEYERDIKPLLRLVLAAPGPLPKGLVLAMLNVGKESWFKNRTRLGAYLIDTPDGLQLFHKTLREWLLDEASGAYFIDPMPASKELGRYLWEKFEKRDAESSLEWRDQILNWLPQLMPLLPEWEDADQLNKLGFYFQMQLVLTQALIFRRRALAIREKTLGHEHPDTATSLNILAKELFGVGDYAAAEPLYRRALAIREKVLGEEHPDMATSLFNLAWLQSNNGNDVAAEPLYRRALAIQEKVFGPEHNNTFLTLHHLARLLKRTGNCAAAEPLFRRARAIREKWLFDTEESDESKRCDRLAVYHTVRRQYAEAEELYCRALAIREKRFGPDHSDVAKNLHDLASLFIQQDRYKEAEILCRRDLAIREKVSGPEEMDTANSCSQLIRVLKGLGQIEEAEKLRRRDLLIWEKKLGSEHPRVAESLDDLAYLTEIQGRKGEAEMLWRRVLAIRLRAFGAKHRDTVTSLNKLADFLCAQGRHEEAETFRCRATVLQEKIPSAE